MQLIISASDGREPLQATNTTVRVTVTRDESAPQFENVPYDDARVSENTAVNQVFYTKVRASDRDLQVIMI